MPASSQSKSVKTIDMSPWTGRVDPEPDSLRWHQVVRPLTGSEQPPGAVLIGFSCDAGVARNQGRTGAANGPGAMRRSLASLAWHQRAPVYEAGDIICRTDSDMEDAQRRLAKRLTELLEAGHFPIVMGGGHEVAFGSWSGLAQHLDSRPEIQAGHKPTVGIVNFDAHFDLRDPKHIRSSGTPFTQIATECDRRGWPFRYACLGVSRASNTQILFDRAGRLGVLFKEDREFQPAHIDEIKRELGRFMAHCEHIYLTIDLDVLPAAEAPGVSAPAARGVSLSLIEPLIEAVRDSGKLRLVDIAELNPDFDIDSRTAKAAARFIHHLTLGR